jgi:succinate dehydrogenase / fumarate reductase cytochrome b subunit
LPKEPILTWLTRALSSSIGKKFVMAATGLLLCGFLVVHLGGNLLLYQGADAYNGYADALHGQEWFVKAAEVILAILFVAHIYLAWSTWRDQRHARHVSYRMKESKLYGRTLAFSPSNWMLVTGTVVLAFLILHLMDFALDARPDFNYSVIDPGGPDQPIRPFVKALMILRNPISAAVYLIGCLALGFHLAHGFWSACQTLGLSHPKYTPFLKYLSFVFAAIIALGFGSFPIWAFAVNH